MGDTPTDPGSTETRTGPLVPALNGRLAAGFELLVVPVLLGLQAAGVVAKPKLPLLLFGWLSLWLRGVGWRRIGLTCPASWPRTVLTAVVVGLAFDCLDVAVILPLLRRLTGESPDVSALGEVEGNARLLLLLVGVSWLSAAFPEELLYRGYFLNRLADLFGRTATGWTASVILSSITFGLAHHGQGIAGVLDNVVAGLLFALLYLASGRNLWLPILAHGVVDTASVILLYLGFHV
jgi:uncharacterized protein